MAELNYNNVGVNSTLDVTIQRGDNLWKVADQVQKDLAKHGKQLTKEQVFGELTKDPRFDQKSADGHLPNQFQKNDKTGRDLDLIYAGDKFKIDLKPAPNVPAHSGKSAYFTPGTSVKQGETHLLSTDGKSKVELGKDGNLHVSVQKEDGSWEEKWSSGISDTAGKTAVFQDDGNLVIKDDKGNVTWQASDNKDTRWDPAAKEKNPQLAVQDDGNLVLMTDQGNGQLKPMWDSKSHPALRPGGVAPGTKLADGESWESADHKTKFEMKDGRMRLSVRDGEGDDWEEKGFSDNTEDGVRAEFVANGDLVIYDKDNKVVWKASEQEDCTQGRWPKDTDLTGKNPQLVVQDDGNVVIVADVGDKKQQPLWDANSGIQN